jgi:hypothetical protein
MTGPWNSFWAVCADANENLFSGTQLYYKEDLDVYTSLPGEPASSTVQLSAEIKKKLEQLYYVAWTSAWMNSVSSAAFQWAVWEITRDLDMTLTGTSGVRIIPADVSDEAVRTRANEFLTAIQENTQRLDLQVWSPVKFENGVYTRVSGQELLVPVPEPSFYATLIIGITAAFGVYYRNSRNRPAKPAASRHPPILG